ncbi:STAS domain-containing protein [Lentzea sp. NPDC051208]|uniref:STAS domain-containing protein n=1 Tax=Lentzea sp. NPDC051208 TaxID=3154642 RepID=UPI00342ADAC1
MSKISIQPLHVQREVHGLAIVVRAAGEVDQETVSLLRTELRTAIAMATPSFPVVVDLTEVRFFGSAGLNQLLIHQRRAAAEKIPLRIVAAHRAVLRSIEMTGLDQVLELHPNVEQALSLDRYARTAS